MPRIFNKRRVLGLSLFILFSIFYGVGNNVKPEAKVNNQASTVLESLAPIENANKDLYLVTRTTDGDTIVILKDGKEQKARLLGVDTPETVDPRKPVQCFGKEASAKTKEALSGKSVSIEKDITQGEYDKYGRLLIYVYLENGELFNKTLISEGYAHEYTHNLAFKYQKEFKSAELQARTNK